MAALHVTLDNFESEVLNADKPVLVDFWAEWCGPCKMLLPTIEELAGEVTNAKICKVNVDEENTQELCNRYNIRSIPTLMFFRGGELVDTVVGATSKENLVARLKACM